MNGPRSVDPGDARLRRVVTAAVGRAFEDLSKPVRKNLANLTIAFLAVLGAARSGNGRISLGAIYRVLPTNGTARARKKRLYRFLENERFDPRGVTGGLARMAFGERGAGLWPVVFDQTKSGTSQALFAGVPFEGRTIPLSVYTFEYPWKDRFLSQNDLEESFLNDVDAALPNGVRAVFIGDRGYARAALVRLCSHMNRLFVIRGRGGVCVEHGKRRCKLKNLPPGIGSAVRYRDVRYQSNAKVPLDVIAFRDPAFDEPWWLLVPAGMEDVLPTETVVALYRERMQVEQTFRDFKTHMGLRGLKLKVRIPDRTGRLLLGFLVAYCLALAVGTSSEAKAARRDLEIPRKKPRHGTTRTLSVLFLAMLMLSHRRWRRKANLCLVALAGRAGTKRSVMSRRPLDVSERFAKAA